MADCWSGQVGNSYCPQIKLSVNYAGATDTSDTFSWTLDYVAHGYGFYVSGNKSWSVSIDGQVWSGSASIYGATGTIRLGSGSKTINKIHSDRNIGFSASMTFNGSWNGSYLGTASCSGALFTAKQTSYTISYNANGGSGAPGAQTKWYGENLTLSGSTPSRTGYSFSKWNTNSSGTGTSYSPGATYSANAGATLYAIWSAYTYTVSYNANGGSGAPGNQTKAYGTTLYLSSTKPTRTNYNFLGWGTSASSTTVAYSPGSAYTANSGITLYAIWQLAYTIPRISNLTADRCNSGGTLTDEGTYAKVGFSWSTDKTVSSIKIEWKLTTASTYSSKTVSASGTSGTVSNIVAGSFNTEYPYDIRVTVSDASGSNSYYTTLGSTQYIIDFRKGGKGVAIGQTASADGFNVNWNTNLNKYVWIGGNLEASKNFSVYGTTNFNGPVGTTITRDNNVGTSWINGRNTASIRNTKTDTGNEQWQSFYPIASCKTLKGTWDIGTLGEDLYFSYAMDSDYNANNNFTRRILFGPSGLPIASTTKSVSYSGSTITLTLHRCYNIVMASIEWVGTCPTNQDLGFGALVIPSGYRPVKNVYAASRPVVGATIYNDGITRYQLKTDGTFRVITNEGGYVERHATVTWITTDEVNF